MELLTVDQIVAAWYRAVGTESDDSDLVQNGESVDDVAYVYLTRGFRAAQRWMVDNGFQSYWRTRSSALSWSGAEATDGGRYTDLPSTFLRLAGDPQNRKSAIVEADGASWGWLIDEEESEVRGQYYYLKGSKLWITRGATPPTAAYLEFHHKHPAFKTGATVLADASLDFEVDARPLGVAEAALLAANQPWYHGDEARKAQLREDRFNAQQEARKIARRTRRARKFGKGRVTPTGTHW